MKSVLRLSLVLFMSLMVAGAFAQEAAQQRQGMRNMDPEAMADRQLEQLKGIVKVESNEEAGLKEVFLNAAKERQEKMGELRESGDREGMMAAMEELNKKRDEELKKILGEERLATYLAELEKLRQERGGQRGL